jgi:hypothetical protein
MPGDGLPERQRIMQPMATPREKRIWIFPSPESAASTRKFLTQMPIVATKRAQKAPAVHDFISPFQGCGTRFPRGRCSGLYLWPPFMRSEKLRKTIELGTIAQ